MLEAVHAEAVPVAGVEEGPRSADGVGGGVVH